MTETRFDTGITVDDIITDKPDSDAPKSTVLNALRQELAQKLQTEDIERVVPSRPSIRVVFRTNVDTYQTQLWRKRASDKSLPDGFDALKFACTVVANMCVGIKFDGVLVAGEDGEPLTFRDKELLDMMGGASGRTVDAVRWLYGSDAHIFKAVEDIFEAAGYSDTEDDDAEDPTLIS